jgi:hypothetical protein
MVVRACKIQEAGFTILVKLQGVGILYENCNAHEGNRRKISSCNEVSKYTLKQLYLYFTPNWTAISSICMYVFQNTSI